MELIDHTGHIYSLTSFNAYPTGYEYETFKHILWLEDEYARKLSVNEWYMRPVRILLHKDSGELSDFNVKVDSTVFKLYGGKAMQHKIAENSPVEIDEEDFTNHLSLDDVLRIEDDNDILLTFYVCGMTSSPATWTSNILVYAEYNWGYRKEWCPITCGGVFYDENEELVINGHNMGIHFPKDIIKALYPLTAGTSIYSDETNEAVYNTKVKEYLMNYMRLHGECGNMDQVKDSLKFFEWGKHITMSQLVRTDNEIITQYIKNFFDVTSDVLWRMDHFEPSALLSLVVNANAETGQENAPDYSADLWGEMKPVMEDLFSKLVPMTYDETEIVFYKPYYEYVITEMMLKLACLRHYYQRYFLPMHAMVFSASVQYYVHANDIKYLTKPFIKLTENPVVAEEDRLLQEVIFPSTDILYAYTQKHHVDSNFNEFSNYDAEADDMLDTDIFYIDDICIEVPIKFIKTGIDFLKCHLILERLGGPVMYESDFTFSQSQQEYQNFIIYPKLMNNMLTMNYWKDKHYCIHLLVNDVWYDWEFMIKVPELHIELGKLKYKYDYDQHRQVLAIKNDEEGREYVDFLSFMYIPSLIDVQNIRFPEEVVAYGHDGVMDKFVSMYRDTPSLISPESRLGKRYYNRVHYYKLLDQDGNEIPYLGNQDDKDPYREDVRALYRLFFDSDGKQVFEMSSGKDGHILDYDLYLMHDSIDSKDYEGILDQSILDMWNPHWYVVLISRQTIDGASVDDPLDAPVFTEEMARKLEGLRLKYMKSDTKWLINRMVWVPTNGVAHFKQDDIIAGTIDNVDLPFILADGSKWKISPMTPGMQADSEVESMTNTFLMSIGGDNTGYDPGYYNITVRYSLDGMIQNQREHRCRIFVER